MKNLTVCLLAWLSVDCSPALAASSSTANPAIINLQSCPGRVGGEWNYGRVPDACNASAFGDDRVVYSTYPALIFMDPKNRTQERNRYTEEVHSLLVEAAHYYIQKRKPTVSKEESDQWAL